MSEQTSIYDLPAGTYELTRDVVNPKPDRRCKRDWRYALVWQQGERFSVEQHPISGSREIRAADAYSYMCWGMAYAKEFLPDLIAALTPVTEIPSDYLRRRTNQNLALLVLDDLVASGRLSWVDLQRAEKQVSGGYDPDVKYYLTEEPLASEERGRTNG